MDPLDPQTILNQEQALAVYTSSGEAVRFFIGQRWQATNYVLAAYVALVVAPELICKNVANGICVLANSVGAALAALTFVLASVHLCNLREEHADQLDLLNAARMKLPLVAELHGPPPSPGPGRIIWVLIAALFVGALLVALINLSRPSVVAWFNTWWPRGHTT
jgi:hypothetical protein